MKAYEVREPNGLDGLMLNADRRQPEPSHEQILVRVRAASLNYRDQGVIKGSYGYTKFPVIPMCDGAGEVVALGPGVTQFKVGDRIMKISSPVAPPAAMHSFDDSLMRFLDDPLNVVGVAVGLARLDQEQAIKEQEQAAAAARALFGQFFTPELSERLALDPDMLPPVAKK